MTKIDQFQTHRPF